MNRQDEVINFNIEPDESLENKKVVSITEAARINNVTRQAIYVAIKQGKLRATKNATRWTIDLEDLEAYRRELEEKSKSETANGLFVAWNTANYSKAKKLPNLKNILKDIFKPKQKVQESKRMSKEQIKQHYKKRW